MFFLTILDNYKHDMFMSYGQEGIINTLRHEAKMRGIVTAYALHTAFDNEFSFIDCDFMFTPSEATAKLYRKSCGIDVKVVGQFIDKQTILATNRAQSENVKYVTFINPLPLKGLAIFVKLHEVFSLKHPEIPFLVINVRNDFSTALKLLHLRHRVPYTPCSRKIEVAAHRQDPRFIYDISRVIVAPSLCQETWGLVATEAIMNGIPVLASKNGGLPEAVREGGILLDVPKRTQKDYNFVPSDKEIAPWVNALERCLNEDWTEACQKASDYNDLERSVDRLMLYLEPWLKHGQQHKHPLEHVIFSPV